MKTNYKKLNLLSALVALLLLASTSAFAQNLVNSGEIKNSGTIKFVDDNGEFQNTNTAYTDAYQGEYASPSGTIEFNGTTNIFAGTNPLGGDPNADANRITGWVIYSNDGAGANQSVQDRAYSNLGMTGAAQKNFPAGDVYVDGVYYAEDGDRDYGTGTFYYDGEGAGTEDQTIFPESGSSGGNNIYNNLYFTNTGVKTLEAGETSNADTEISLDANATVIVQGTMQALASCVINTAGNAGSEGLFVDGTGGGATDGYFRTNNGIGTISGNVYIHDGGTYITDGSGLQTFSGTVEVGDDGTAGAGSSGSLTLDQGDVTIDGGTLDLYTQNGAIVAGTGTTLELAGGFIFTNQVDYGTGTRSNMQFSPTSTALYSGTGEMCGTQQAYPYGHLEITNAGNSEPEGADASVNIFLQGDLTCSGGDVYMDNNSNPDDGSSVLAMLDPTASVTLADNLEIRGAVRHYYEANGLGALIFNNKETSIEVTDNGAETEYITLWTYELTTPGATDANIGATDINRRFKIDYNMTGGGNWTGTIQAAYLTDEDPFLDDEDRQTIRFRDYGATAGMMSTKLATGSAVQHDLGFDNGALYNTASLGGITSNSSGTLTSAYLASDDEFLLRGGPTWFITINDGRWSNPGTWDEGIQPGPKDLCMVRHTVHAGYVNDRDGYAVNEDVHLDDFSTDESELAAYIQIYNDAIYDGALLMGEARTGDDANDYMQDPNWGMYSGSIVGTWTSTEDTDIDPGEIYMVAIPGGETVLEVDDTELATAREDEATTTLYNGGLFVFNGTTFTIPVTLTNNSIIKNAGEITIGE